MDEHFTLSMTASRNALFNLFAITHLEPFVGSRELQQQLLPLETLEMQQHEPPIGLQLPPLSVFVTSPSLRKRSLLPNAECSANIPGFMITNENTISRKIRQTEDDVFVQHMLLSMILLLYCCLQDLRIAETHSHQLYISLTYAAR